MCACLHQAEAQLSSDSLLMQLCAILFTGGRQLQRLSVSAGSDGVLCSNAYLPREIIRHMSTAATLESLNLLVPESRTFRTLAESVASLRRLKVGALPYLAASIAARLRCMLHIVIMRLMHDLPGAILLPAHMSVLLYVPDRHAERSAQVVSCHGRCRSFNWSM